MTVLPDLSEPPRWCRRLFSVCTIPAVRASELQPSIGLHETILKGNSWRSLAPILLAADVGMLGAAVLWYPRIVLAVLMGSILAIMIILRPYVALIAFFFLVPFNLVIGAALEGHAHITYGYLSNWKDILLVALLVRGVFDYWRRPQRRFLVRRGDYLLIVYVAMMAVLAIGSPFHVPALYGLARDVEGPLLFLAILTLAPPPKVIRACLIAILGAALIVAVGALIERGPKVHFLTWYGAPVPTAQSSFWADANQTVYRSGSFLDSPLLLGFYMAAVVPIAAALAFAWPAFRRSIPILVTFVGLAAAFYSYTRAAYVGLVVGLIVTIALAVTVPAIRLALIGVILCLAAFGVVGVLYNSTVLTRTEDTASHASAVVDDLRLIAERPFGYGLGTTDAVRYRFQVPALTHASESTYLAVGLESGYLGLGLYLGATFYLLMRIRGARFDGLRASRWGIVAIASGAMGSLVAVGVARSFLGVQELVIDSIAWACGALAVVALSWPDQVFGRPPRVSARDPRTP